MGVQVIRVFRDLVGRSGMNVDDAHLRIMELADHVIALEDGKFVSQTINVSTLV
jgi:putative ABC transport system ATP-binding protein